MIARNRQALFWALAFPLIFVVAFGLFFRDRDAVVAIAVVDHASDNMSRRLISELGRIDGLRVVVSGDEADVRRQVVGGDVGFAFILPRGLAETAAANPPARIGVFYDDAHPGAQAVIGFMEGFIGRANIAIAQVEPALALESETVTGPDMSYLDFVMPGLAVWGVMSFSVIGLATTLTAYREKKILTRIQATPLPVRVFFTAKVLAYLMMSLAQVCVILAVGTLVFGTSIRGNIAYIAFIIVIGNLMFLNLGFIVAARSRTVAAASGLGNAVVLPLLFFSGVFFPVENLPTLLRYAVPYLPLSPIMAMMRGVTLEARPLLDFPVELATAMAWLAITAVVAVKIFRFR